MWLLVEWLDLTRIFLNRKCCLQLRISCRYDQLQILVFLLVHLPTHGLPTYLPMTCTMKSLHRRFLGPTLVNQYLGAIQEAI